MAQEIRSDELKPGVATQVVRERQREMAIEHLLFWTIRHVERHHPGLIDALEQSLDRLGDPAHDGTKDDGAVREIAEKFLKSLRAES